MSRDCLNLNEKNLLVYNIINNFDVPFYLFKYPRGNGSVLVVYNKVVILFLKILSLFGYWINTKVCAWWYVYRNILGTINSKNYNLPHSICKEWLPPVIAGTSHMLKPDVLSPLYLYLYWNININYARYFLNSFKFCSNFCQLFHRNIFCILLCKICIFMVKIGIFFCKIGIFIRKILAQTISAFLCDFNFCWQQSFYTMMITMIIVKICTVLCPYTLLIWV